MAGQLDDPCRRPRTVTGELTAARHAIHQFAVVGSPIGLPGEAMTIATALKSPRRDRPVRQEPPAISMRFATVHGFDESSAICIN
jgi:hypothetical protein